MKILQITCGFPYSKVYRNLFEQCVKDDIDIEVYVPKHTNLSCELDTNDCSYPIYSNNVIVWWDKYIFFSKIYKMRCDIERNFTLSNISVIHAHSLFSDGGVAYELFKKYRIPYIVAIRDTDINQYFQKAKHLKPYALKILKNAKAIIFLSPAYQEKVINTFVPVALQDNIIKKSLIIPNGISDFWLTNTYKNRPVFDHQKEQINLIFVGQIIRRKNIENVIKAGIELSKRIDKKVNILLIGQQKDQAYYKYLSTLGHFEYIEYCAPEELINYYRKADIFVMPSFTETFGLVYAESISQGLPVIYTYGQGFDGQFAEGQVGYGVNPLSVNDIVNKINIIIGNYDNISNNCIMAANKFDWIEIVKSYKKLYERINNDFS